MELKNKGIVHSNSQLLIRLVNKLYFDKITDQLVHISLLLLPHCRCSFVGAPAAKISIFLAPAALSTLGLSLTAVIARLYRFLLVQCVFCEACLSIPRSNIRTTSELKDEYRCVLHAKDGIAIDAIVIAI